jgi:hypothetical protein
VKVVEKTCQTVAPGSVSSPARMRNKDARWAEVAC